MARRIKALVKHPSNVCRLPRRHEGSDKFDRISIAENDDQEFEQLAGGEEAEQETDLMRVRDWHVMLETTEQEHGGRHGDTYSKPRKNRR